MNYKLILLIAATALVTACSNNSGGGSGDAPAPQPTPTPKSKSQIELDCEKGWSNRFKNTPKGQVATYSVVSKTGDFEPVTSEVVIKVEESTAIKFVQRTVTATSEKVEETMRLDFIEECIASNATYAPKDSTVVADLREVLNVAAGSFETRHIMTSTPQGSGSRFDDLWYTSDLLLVKTRVENTFILDGSPVVYTVTTELQSLRK